MINEAIAQTANIPAIPAGAQGGAMSQIFVMAVIFLIFYVLLIRPQQKRFRDHQKMIDNLSKGDEVVTSGGIIAKILKIEENEITIDTGNGVQFKVVKNSISSRTGNKLPLREEKDAKPAAKKVKPTTKKKATPKKTATAKKPAAKKATKSSSTAKKKAPAKKKTTAKKTKK